jgi:hypothetical protein
LVDLHSHMPPSYFDPTSEPNLLQSWKVVASPVLFSPNEWPPTLPLVADPRVIKSVLFQNL